MPSTRKIFTWLVLSSIIVLSTFVSVVLITNWAAQHSFHIPPCEAMRPYIEYHGITYFATLDGSALTSSDLGNVITTTGEGQGQATSCMPSGLTVYSMKGYPSTSRLAVYYQGLMVFEPYSPTPTPSPTASPVQP